MTNDYDDMLISKSPSLVSGRIEKQITVDFIMDLYDRHREMEDGETKDAFYSTVKIVEDHIGQYLVVSQKN